MMMRVIGATMVVIALLGALVYSQRRPEALKVSGFVEADEIRVGSRVGGRVREVFAVEGQKVERDEPLIELEPYDLHERQREAEAVLAERKARLSKLEAGYRALDIAQAEDRFLQLAAVLKKLENGPREQEIRAAEAALAQAEAQLKLATDNQRRAERLQTSGAITQEELDRVISELRVARATQQVREAELDLLRAGTRPEEIEEAKARLKEAEHAWQLQKQGFREEEIAEARAAVQAAEASLAVIRQQIDELTIRAPVTGIVEAVELQPGDLVGANTPAISLMDVSRLWVRAYVPENRLAIEVGQRVPVTVDSYPGREFTGQITFIARQAEFTPGNVQTPEERSKQVFRIKVTLDRGEDLLRPGMAADVWLDREPRQP